MDVGVRHHALAIAIKTIIVLGTLMLAAQLAGAGVSPALLLVATLLLVGIGYPLGDVYTLQMSGNAVATALDAALALGVLWSLMAVQPRATTVAGMWVTAGALTAAEWFFHRWLERQVGLRAHFREVDPHEKDE